MKKDIHEMNTSELLQEYKNTGGATGSDEQTHESPGGYPPHISEEIELEEETPDEEETQDEVEEISPIEYLEMRAQERLQGMSPTQKSAANRILREAQKQEEMEKANDFQEDAAEFASKYSAFPDVLEKFYADWRFGRLKFTPAERADFETSETPAEDMLFFWANKQKLPSRTLRGIIDTYHNGPRLRSRFRDRLAGFNKQPRKRMTDKEIKETVDSILEE